MTNLPKQLVVAVDCDDVLVATTPYFVEAYNERYGTSAALEDAHSISHEIWGANPELVIQRMGELTMTDEYTALGPTDDEVEVLDRLSQYHALHLVTARKPEEHELTQAMVDRDLPDVFESLDFVGWSGSKGEVCKRIGADILVDDSIRHLHDALKWGLPKGHAILFGDYPWNVVDASQLKGIVRCPTWQDVERVVGEISYAK